jgi:hypothetical protein
MAIEERTQSIRSLDHIGAAGIRLLGDNRLAGGADVCAKQAMVNKRDKQLDRIYVMGLLLREIKV